MIGKVLRRLENLVAGRRAFKFLVREWTELGDLDRLAAALATQRFSANLRPVVMEGPAAKRIAVIAPHPDDEVIGPGGTLIRAIRGGAAVHVLYLTNADGETGEARAADAAASSASLGYVTEFLGYAADRLPVDEDAARRLGERLCAHRPQAVLVPFLSDDHPDHRRASELLLMAERGGVLPCDFEVWAYQVYGSVLPNVVVDITDVAEGKAEAIRLWRNSAMRSRDWAHYALGMNAYHSRLLPATSEARWAETFLVLPKAEYIALCAAYY